MGKRGPAEAAVEARQVKKLHVDSAVQYDDDDDDFTTAQTPSSMAEAESPATVATTPRTKFPSDLKTLACTWPGCPKAFNRPARLRDHLNSHTNSRPFKCPYDDCDKDYIEDKHLKQHIKAAHTNERKYTCQVPGCGKGFVTGTRLKRHQAVHEGAERFRCQECGQSFRKRETLTKHVRKEHLHMRAYACPEQGCPESFDSKPALKRHRDKIHGEIKYWCGECGLQTQEDGTQRRIGFTTELLLHAHLRKEHQNCLFCDFKPSSRWELDQHVDMHHSGKTVQDRQTHACTHEGCSKKFTKKSNLKTHVRSAHEGFRFTCGGATPSGPDFAAWTNDQGCGAKFSTKVRLDDHIRFIHLGHERPRPPRPDGPAAAQDPTAFIDEISGLANQAKRTVFCPDCDQGFKRYHDLQVHLSNGHEPAADPSNDPAPFPNPDDEDAELSFGGDFHASTWLRDMAEDDVFAAQMDHGPPKDEWLEDEANIMLLARDSPHPENIDPSLSRL
ncbi:Zinc finger, C2H2-type/integrase, DNA-binding protein [Metarhizium album ARSEF 1941]|uniref:Zinc finger, C2H2-type/integrase, DNA-binding protein n=1 Tax=Metarhizium album (strain ARSEF 1941) TaxID=1081103 RepID=A0A0B2WUB5_METAS|nr:Zinc finger, C2H2-type/integrase, DNA-binding protein [Metarhizium album ARSEF 1941]KHN99666.1 Zinc finger, C2H2-type/integrase, DNA-binding protein [Metarhizium album ARSEF 1941]